MIAPSTNIILYKTDIELDNMNQLKFNTWDDQWRYFSNLPHIHLENATFQRKEGVIRYPTEDISYDELIRYNYVSYKNEAYANKTFFAYVKNMRYINDGMTEIEIETDVFQSWQFDLIYRKCFTEREHVSDDTFGKHTVPENLETGEYMYQPCEGYDSNSPWNTLVDKTRVVFALTENGFGFVTQGGDRKYNGIFGGLQYYVMESEAYAENYIKALQHTAGGVIDGLYAIFLAPDDLLGINSQTQWTQTQEQGYNLSFIELPYSDKYKYLTNCYITDSRKCGLNYRPANNKVLCYPYRFINVSNNAGQTNQYRYEYFKENTRSNNYYCGFGVDGAISVGCSIKLYPTHYNNPEIVTEGTYGHNYLEGLDCYKLPTCSWVTDPYLNWLSQNAVSLATTSAHQIGAIVGGAALSATGAGAAAGVGLIASGISGVFSTISQGVEHFLEPATAHGGQNQGDLNFATKRAFTPYCMSIKDEYAKIIDDYFNVFGYKVNALKVPEIHSRENWNYVKTINCNFSGDIPGDDLLKIRELFDYGITIWHNPSTFLDYSQRNRII